MTFEKAKDIIFKEKNNHEMLTAIEFEDRFGFVMMPKGFDPNTYISAMYFISKSNGKITSGYPNPHEKFKVLLERPT